MQSSGGTVGARAASAKPVSLLMSGPVAGLIGGIWAGRMAGHENVITLDMGGTSADIGVAPGGELRMRHLVDTTVARLPGDGADGRRRHDRRRWWLDRLRRPWRDLPRRAAVRGRRSRPGLLRARRRGADVDRRAARARPPARRPGPARRARCSSIASSPSGPMATIADRLGVTTTEAALGVLQIQKYGMTQSIELNSVRRGYDPREFTLVAAGGAGPLFACDIALELEIPRVLVPPHPGHHVGDRPARDRRRPRVRRDDDDAAAPPRRGEARAHLRRARGAGGPPARRGRLSRRPGGRHAARGLPLRRAGLRGALRGARRARRRRRLGRAHDGGVPPRPRTRVRPALRRRDRHRQRARRAASASCRRSSGRPPSSRRASPRPRSSGTSCSSSMAAPARCPRPSTTGRRCAPARRSPGRP